MTALGIDFSRLKNLTPERFGTICTTLSTTHMTNKWKYVDALVFAADNPEYEDVLAQVEQPKELNVDSYKKYVATARDFPIRRRKWNMSIDIYYTVTSLRNPETGEPYENIQDNLLQKAANKFDNDEPKVRDWLRNEVKKVKREPIIETETITGTVGSLDDMLRRFHQLPDGYEVTIKYTKVIEYNSSDTETEVAEMAIAS